ncbi:hypothetical protein GQX73_g10753 [Xylaria multiplex]|uniref:Rhodopsin domain-containing protein n=1 Tax=Xylaria multiplex TaxID=323545 RepID=A0A7C8INZ2_9PEZI|nr:hypothetical protein GQX73_g10753 [Xylaria multiplex]
MATGIPPGIDLCAIPLAVNPDGLPPNFENPPSLQPTLIGISAVVLTFSVVTTAGRLYVNKRALKPADYCMAVGLILNIAIAGVIFSRSREYRHAWDTPICWYTTRLAKLDFVEGLLSGPALFFPKAAIFLFYLQIFSINRPIKIGSKIGLVMAFIAYFPTSLITVYFTAPHVGQTWDDVVTSTLPVKGVPVGITAAAASIIVDIYIFILPLPAISALKIPLSKKIQLVALFTTAFFGIVASVISLVFRVALLGFYDSGWQLGRLAITIIVENNIAIIVGSLPAFTNFLRTYVSNNALYKSLRSKFSIISNNYASGSAQHDSLPRPSTWARDSPQKRQPQYNELTESVVLKAHGAVPEVTLIATREMSDGTMVFSQGALVNTTLLEFVKTFIQAYDNLATLD